MKKNNGIKLLITVLTFGLVLILSGCYTPNPLYGTWSDNNGNYINFINDGTYNAKVNINNVDYGFNGDWTVIENILIFSFSDGGSINTEWDIRGAMLYLIWTYGGSQTDLILYHTAR